MTIELTPEEKETLIKILNAMQSFALTTNSMDILIEFTPREQERAENILKKLKGKK